MNDQDKLLQGARRAITQNDYARALAAADEALHNNPREEEAMCIAAIALQRLGNFGIALQLLNVASQLTPDNASTWHNIGRCLHERAPAHAYRAFKKANDLEPDDLLTMSALCNVSSSLGRNAEAVEWAERCFKMHGHHPDAAHNASFALFAMGRWEEGWKLFRSSIGSTDRVTRNYHENRETPRWVPGVHKDATVVLYGEQGIGDEILYASMIDQAVSAARDRGSRLIIECDERNAGLFRRSFDATVYGTRANQYCDWPAIEKPTHKMEFGGLGEHFGNAPFRVGGFLTADPVRRAMWRSYLGSAGHAGRPRVGLAWTGGSWATGRARRSVDFASVAELINAHSGVDFVCLEYEDRRDELADLPNVLNPHWATRKGADFDDMAALVSELDLVISVTTSAVDLCGALGVPCWALCDAHPQWRYSDFLGPDKMFFYESVKTYRQEEWGDWSGVLGQVSADLAKRYAREPACVG